MTATIDDGLSTLNADETAFLARARANVRKNMDWLAFEEFAFGMQSPLFAKTRSHKDVRENPLYLALRDMWLDLGVRQGYIANPQKEQAPDATGRKATGRR